jgi:hypothetical protein
MDRVDVRKSLFRFPYLIYKISVTAQVGTLILMNLCFENQSTQSIHVQPLEIGAFEASVVKIKPIDIDMRFHSQSL